MRLLQLALVFKWRAFLACNQRCQNECLYVPATPFPSDVLATTPSIDNQQYAAIMMDSIQKPDEIKEGSSWLLGMIVVLQQMQRMARLIKAALEVF